MSQIFDVTLRANLPLCTMPGYHQWIEAYQDGRYCGSHGFEPNPGTAAEPEEERIVLRRDVAADFGSQAIRRFMEWQEKGYPESWLTETRPGKPVGPE
jgi:hypothetical protein